jgi:hypothetical protein
MIIGHPGLHRRRNAVAGVLATIILFTLVFAGGVTFLVYTNQASLQSNQANAGRQATLQAASLEKLALSVKLSQATDPWSQKGDLALTINNTGGVSTTVVDVYVTNAANGQFVSSAQVPPSTPYLSKDGTLALGQKGDLNVTLPLSIGMGASTRTMTGCISGKTGCDIAISKTSVPYASGETVIVSVLTSTGNVFSAQYPLSSTTTGYQSSTLVVTMIATPPQVPESCSGCVALNVTVYNYASSSVTTVSLVPAVPSANVTGTASITSGSCPPPPSTTIQAYPGSGNAHKISFICTYSANTGPVGGFASFFGSATGYLNGIRVSSAQEVSNTIQIGAAPNVLNQGPFTAEAKFFKDSYCLQNGIFYVAPCQQTPNPLNLGTLPNAIPQNGSADRYVAYYVQITNNFNTTLPILQYTYFQTDPTIGGESDFYLVGDAPTYNSTLSYFPNYAPNTPTLTAYGGDAVTCAQTPIPFANCIALAPHATITLTFAACRAGASDWNWGASQYGRAFDNPTGCTPQSPPNYQTPEATYLSIVIAFLYKPAGSSSSQVFVQQIPFQGDTIFGGTGGSVGASCSTGSYCGTVVYTQYTGTVGYFNFIYNPAAKTFSIPTPPYVINNNLPHGADGVVYNPQDHKLLVGTNSPNDQSQWFNEVDPNTGAVTSFSSNTYSLNVMVSSDGTRVYMDGDGCQPNGSGGCLPLSNNLAWAPLTPTVGPASNTLTLTGDDTVLNTVIFVSPTLAYYVAELTPQFRGETGHIGVLNPTTGVTTCFKTGASCTVYNGVHGAVYDPFSKDLIVFGYDVVDQINPATGAVVATETVSSLAPYVSSGNFDQGAVDGFGHLFISFAGNPGFLYFEDYSSTGVIGQTNFNMITNGGNNDLGGTAFNYIDDLAPIVGPGSQG